MAHNKVSCEDHHWQRVWRGNTLSGYWIDRCQRCGIERFVEPEDDYHTTIEYTIVNQTGRERFTELEAERDALRAELAELQIYRDCVSRACRRYSALDEDSNLVIPDGAKALVILFRERDALREELDVLDDRSCETCAWHIDGSTECRQDVLIPVGLPTDKFWCSFWKEEE